MTKGPAKLPDKPRTTTVLIIPRAEFYKLLKDRIEFGNSLQSSQILTQDDFEKFKKEYYAWDEYNSELLKQKFNNEDNEYKNSYDKTAVMVGFSLGGRPSSPKEKIENLKEKLRLKVNELERLQGKVELLKCLKEDEKFPEVVETLDELSNRIFIIHGHDERTKIEVARSIEQLGLVPIILHEQANEGRTIIEKFEVHSNVEFAIAILTCDDLGRKKGQEHSEEIYRARQNVILELGYFIGKLGRHRVFPLYESGVDLPSDINGLLYVPLDDGGKWKFDLVKELKAVGYEVDANKLI